MRKVHKMKLKAENISFKYPSADKYIIKNIDLELDNKKIIGLIGDSGSGKSTFCKILSGYITKFEGSVTLDGQPLPKKGFKPEGFRKNYYQDTKEDAVIMWKYFEFYEDYDSVKD